MRELGADLLHYRGSGRLDGDDVYYFSDAGKGGSMMPHFGLKTLLVATTAFALWVSTFTGYSGAPEVRAFIVVSIVITSGMAALSYTGRRRAFWIGFSATFLFMLTTGWRTAGARFDWAMRLSRDLPQYLSINIAGRGDLVLGINSTIIYGTTLLAAVLMGFMCVYVNDRAQEANGRN